MQLSETLKENLTENEKLFADYYYNQSSDTFGNGTQSVIRAFGEDAFPNKEGGINYNYAGVKAHELLRMPKVYTYGEQWLTSQGFNDTSVDTQHSFLINQSADLSIKAKAIDIYNKLKNRYSEKVHLTGNIKLQWADDNNNPVQASQ